MYSARITREHRTAFIVLTDRSGSMAEDVLFDGVERAKSVAVARILNRFLEELVNRCRREGGVRDYFDIAVLEYGADGVIPLLGDTDFITPSELVKLPAEKEIIHLLRRLPDGSQVTAAREETQWIKPKASGSTPMGDAMAEAERLARRWCAAPGNLHSFPPVVINITDGEASDACYRDLCDCAERIKQTGTRDGNTLLVNIHLARRAPEYRESISFPSRMEELPPHPYARLLWDMSSIMPECYEQVTSAGSLPPFRAMSYNCAVDELFAMLTIGSVSGTIIG